MATVRYIQLININSKRYCGGQDIVVANDHTVNDLSGTNFDNAINSFSCTGEYYYTEPLYAPHSRTLHFYI